jgi:hypothetical protein
VNAVSTEEKNAEIISNTLRIIMGQIIIGRLYTASQIRDLP